MRAFRAAERMLGVRFRLQGRDAARGLDCVGLIWAAYQAAGVLLIAPRHYPLRGWCGARVIEALDHSGLVRADDMPIKIGDVAMVVGEAGQFHLGMMGVGQVIHAHAGLRHVVAAPLDEEWCAARRWRLPAA
ncbi:MAG TPA: NlpC/P60 family protein [Sphingopyxis sp.]|nr:NlpC/P60 family protein [Sphingopyxis sp.]